MSKDSKKEWVHLPDTELVKQAQRELPYSTNAFSALVSRYQDKVFSKAYSMLKNRRDAEDITQEVFIRIFQSLKDFKNEATFSTWVYAITVNACLTFLDKRKRDPLWLFSGSGGDDRESFLDDEQMFYWLTHIVEDKELKGRIFSAMQKIQEESRRVLYLRYFYEMDYDQISQTLGIGVSAAKMRVKRAKEEIRKYFKTRIGTYCMLDRFPLHTEYESWKNNEPVEKLDRDLIPDLEPKIQHRILVKDLMMVFFAGFWMVFHSFLSLFGRGHSAPEDQPE